MGLHIVLKCARQSEKALDKTHCWLADKTFCFAAS